jgi:hypothetical protein
MSMNLFLQGAVFLAALVFIAVSALMNALFLSSLGRTEVEVALFAAVSVAADIAKAVLPVLLARAIVLRAWGYAAVTSVMLLLVVAVSLASGIGFASMTRDAVTAERAAKSQKLLRRRDELAQLEKRIAAAGDIRSSALLEAELTVLKLDRRWATSKACTDVTLPATRTFCGEIVKLDGLGRQAELHTGAIDDRNALIRTIEELEHGGAGQASDQQVAAIATLFGVAADMARVVITSSVAITLELGSILLVLLASGPMLRGWQQLGSEAPAPAVAATLPVQADRSHWQRQRQKALGAFGRDVGGRCDNHGH